MSKKLPLFNYESLVHAIAAVTGSFYFVNELCPLLSSSNVNTVVGCIKENFVIGYFHVGFHCIYCTLAGVYFEYSGSTVAITSFYPLDLIKFRIQLDDRDIAEKSILQSIFYIIQNEGLTALYRGLRPNVTTMGVSNFVYFYVASGLRNLVPEGLESTKTDLIINALAGIANVLLTNPIWVVTNRLKSKEETPFKGLFAGLCHIANNEGIGALWYGVVPSLILVSNPVIHFTIYQGLKRRIDVKSAVGYFLLGALSKSIATIITYPLQVAQTRQRRKQEGKLSTAAILLKLLKKNGLPGLYQGLETKMLQTVLATALMFMCYEKITQYVFLLLLGNSRRKLRK